MTQWILVLWIWNSQGGYPSYFGQFGTKERCEKVAEAIEIRMPGNGTTVMNHMCVDQYDPLESGPR